MVNEDDYYQNNYSLGLKNMKVPASPWASAEFRINQELMRPSWDIGYNDAMKIVTKRGSSSSFDGFDEDGWTLPNR